MTVSEAAKALGVGTFRVWALANIGTLPSIHVEGSKIGLRVSRTGYRVLVRRDAVAAWKARKDASVGLCRKGHPRTTETTRTIGGRTVCLICRRLAVKRYKAAVKERR